MTTRVRASATSAASTPAPASCRPAANDGVTVRVDAARGDFPGAPRTRNWTIRLLDVPATGRVRMTVGGRPRGVADSEYDVETRTRTISTGPVRTTAQVRVSLLR